MIKYSRLFLVVMLLVVSTACRAGPIPEPPPTEAVSERMPAAERGILRIPAELPWGGKESLDPASPTPFLEAVWILYDTLVAQNIRGALTPALAVSWESDETATQWSFELREGVVFHDGRPFTAEDVVYTINHILDPDLESPPASNLKLIEKVEAVDDNTVLFSLAQPFADFPLLLIDPQTAIIPAGSGETIGKTGIGTGPFKLESLDIEGSSLFPANDEYWTGPPGLAAIEVTIFLEAENEFQALLDGRLDYSGSALTADQIAQIEQDPDFVIQEFPTGNWLALVMRTDTPPFDDARLRKALRIVANRQEMVEFVLAGKGTPTCDHPVWIGDPYRADFDCPQDIETAKALLAEAGYPDGLEIPLYATDFNPYVMPLTEIYREQAAEAGITVNIQKVPIDLYWSKTWMVEPFFASFWYQRPADQILNVAWRSDSSWNESFWDNPAYDRILDEARQELDFEKRKQLYVEAQRKLYDEGGTLIPFHFNRTRVYKRNVAGLEPIALRQLDWAKVEKTE